MVVRKPLLKPAEVERLLKCGEIDREARWELVDGEIVDLAPTSPRHGQICIAIIEALLPFARRIGAKLFTADTGFLVGALREQLRAPDLALVSRERLHIVEGDRAWATEAPDLAVEVLSPEQHGEAYARGKVAEYLAAGGKGVWLVDPESRAVRVYEAGAGEYAIYPADSAITLEAIAPGFSAPVGSFFP
jgi:Uma2 family endonuclease